jgi:hypothetical protein
MEAVESLAQRTPTEMTMNAAANRKFFKQTAHIMAEIIDTPSGTSIFCFRFSSPCCRSSSDR